MSDCFKSTAQYLRQESRGLKFKKHAESQCCAFTCYMLWLDFEKRQGFFPPRTVLLKHFVRGSPFWLRK